jgi:hypothetical protein
VDPVDPDPDSDPDPPHCRKDKEDRLLPERWRVKVEAHALGILSLSSQRDRCRTSRLQDYSVHSTVQE